MKPVAHLVLRNVRPLGSSLADIAITSGCVTAIGPQLPAGEIEIDGHGRDIIPGLHDHHLHLFATAARRTMVDLAGCIGRDAVAAALRKHAGDLPAGNWVRAGGLTEIDAPIPDRFLLDQWISDRPMRIQDRTGALWLLNSRAISAMGPGPWPECVECDSAGDPTGRIWRGDTWLRSILPAQPPSLRAISREMAAFGITSVTDAGPSNGPQELALFEAATRSGDLLQRLTMMGTEDLPDSDVVRRGPVKLLYDETALPDVAHVANRITVARSQGRNVAAHCVTLGELLFFLAALECAGGARAGDRIEHGSIIPQSLLTDIVRAGLTVVTQPGFIRTRGDRYLCSVERHSLPDLYRLRSLMRAGIPVLAGSDAPYGNTDPWQAIHAAMTRTTQSGAMIGPAETISMHKALALYSADSGIRVGMAADLCVLGTALSALNNPCEDNPVVLTIINGQAVRQ